MLTQADRAAERRRVKLEELQPGQGRFAEDPQDDARGALALSRRAGRGAAQVTSFFVAGIKSNRARTEKAYSELRVRSLLAAAAAAAGCGESAPARVGRPVYSVTEFS
jgi:hypothetical protein